MDVIAPGPTDRSRQLQRALSTAFWWIVTIVVLVVLDDLTFGPLFWLIARTGGPVLAVVAIYATYVPVQVWLVQRATMPDPGRVARFMLARLRLERRSPRIAAHESQIHDAVVGGVSAVLMSLVLGGVVPLLLLARRGYDPALLRKLSWITASVYATEFAILHGVLPSAI